MNTQEDTLKYKERTRNQNTCPACSYVPFSSRALFMLEEVVILSVCVRDVSIHLLCMNSKTNVLLGVGGAL